MLQETGWMLNCSQKIKDNKHYDKQRKQQTKDKGRYVDQPILGKLAFSLSWKLCQSQKLKNITPNLSPGKATFVFNIGK